MVDKFNDRIIKRESSKKMNQVDQHDAEFMIEEKTECQCFYCQKHKEIWKAKKEQNVNKLAEIAMQLGNKAVIVEFDNDYHSSILDGSWPRAVEILEHSLKKAKEIEGLDSSTNDKLKEILGEAQYWWKVDDIEEMEKALYKLGDFKLLYKKREK